MHQPAAPAWKTVAEHRDQIDIGGGLGNAFFHNGRRLVDHRQKQPPADLVGAVIAAGDPGQMGLFQCQIGNDRVINLAAAARISIPTRACFPAQLAQFDHAVGDGNVTPLRVPGGVLAAAVGMGDIKAGQILRLIRPHGIAKLNHGLIHLPGGGTIHENRIGGFAVARQYPIADKSVAHAGQNRRLVQRLGQGKALGQGPV